MPTAVFRDYLATILVIGIALSCVAELAAQQPSPPEAQPNAQDNGYMRVLLRPTHPPVFDSHHRPITAGGFVEGAPIVFEDVTKQSAIDKFLHRSGTPAKSTIIEVPGSGVALLDYDNDGWPDIYVANYGKNRLYHNNHNGNFTDVAEKAGVALGGWSAGPSWGDYDHDGRVDLFVPGYAKFDPDHAQSCDFMGTKLSCGPLGMEGEPDHLFHNNGDGTFTDVSTSAGVADAKGYYGFASTFVDADDDGWVDLLVANDSRPNYLYRNRHNGTFEETGYLSGFALTEDGRPMASMGIAVGDYNRDGKVDFYISNFSDDYSVLFKNEGSGIFSDVTYQAGLVEPTIPFLKWGTGFLDYDNDGLLDLFVANGHVFPIIDKQNWGTTWAQRPQLFRNIDGTRFQEVPPASGSGLAEVIPARGAAFGDIFNDGHIDVVINNVDALPTLLRNVARNGNHWVGLKLIGGPKSPRDAIGAKVFLTAGGVRQRADVFSGGSYGSNSDPRVHFGLGRASKVDKVEIQWPSGTRQEISLPRVDKIFTVDEAKGLVK
ncbi:MAG TPA: CRTAC1 family protein [Terriglobales bacterium]|nr:CRTAC1 family protein [Terriglobales bacterium]